MGNTLLTALYLRFRMALSVEEELIILIAFNDIWETIFIPLISHSQDFQLIFYLPSIKTDGACALDEGVKDWMSRISNSAADEGLSGDYTSDSITRSKRDSNSYSRHNFWTTAFEAQGRIGPANK